MYNLTMTLSIAQALRVDYSPCIAFVGAGGKTTAMFQLARQLTPPVIVTATSHLGVWQLGLADQHITAATPEPIEKLEYGSSAITLVTGEIDGDRTKPIDDELMLWLHQYCSDHSIPLLIEADGAKQKPLKAWAEHEPPIPSFVKQVVQVVGLSGLGKPLTEDVVHRSERFAGITGLETGNTITADALAKVLTSKQAGLKNIPSEARRTVLLNQADTPDQQSAAKGLAQSLLPFYQTVVISSLNEHMIHAVHEPVAGIILAAGGSSRFGKAKQLLDWHGQPFVHAVAKTALMSGLAPIVMITGSDAQAVESAVHDIHIEIAFNRDWKSGQGTSIKEGITSLLGKWVGGAIFLLADQPQVTSSVLRALMEKHAEGLFPIVAPMVMDQRANPVLFDRCTFNDLLNIEGDVGGRAIFHKHRVEYVPWNDDRLLLDVDTPEMYQRLISDDTL